MEENKEENNQDIEMTRDQVVQQNKVSYIYEFEFMFCLIQQNFIQFMNIYESSEKDNNYNQIL